MSKLLILLLLPFIADSQIALNPGIDTSAAEHKEILAFWKSYVKTNPTGESSEYLKFWNEDDKLQFRQPDLTLHAIGEVSIFSMGYKTLLSILPYQDDYYQIKTAFGWPDSTDNIFLLCITNHYVKKVDDNYKLFSSFKVNREYISIKETPHYKIYTSKNTSIPESTLKQLSDFILKLKEDYAISDEKQLNIIYGENPAETYEILGFDFNLLTSTNNPSRGISSITNNLIIVNGLASIFHEATHIYLNPLFPDTPLKEGLATYYGGSMGKSLSSGINFLDDYASQNTDLNLYEKLKNRNFYINNEFNPIYILQGLLVKIAYDRDGVEGIKDLLAYESYERIFEEYFKLRAKDDIDAFLRAELSKNSD